MEEGWNLTPILIPLAALLAGWAIGFFDSNLRTAKKIKQAEDSAQIAIKQAEQQAVQAQAVAEKSAARDDRGLLRVGSESGRLTLDLDGVRVDTSAMTTDQRKRLIEMLNVMRPWLEGKPASTPPPPPAPAPVADTRQGTSTPIAAPPPRPVTLPPAPAAKNKQIEPDPAPTSIVAQINLILQAHIAGTPLASRGVVLLEAPTGGVSVYIGMDKFEGVDAVPDDEAKSAIRAAIAEWEKKYTPGL